MKIPYNLGDAGAHQERLRQILDDVADDLKAIRDKVDAAHTDGPITLKTTKSSS